MSVQQSGDGDPQHLAQDRWDEAHRQARFRPRFPHDQVVRWAFRNFPRSTERSPHILDLGTGAGRHAVFLASEGYLCSACDLSAEGVKHLQTLAQEKALSISVEQCPADDLACYAADTFDGIVCFGVLYYMSHAQIEKSVAEMYRVLRPGGRILCVTRTDADGRLKGARQIAPFSFVLEAIDGAAPSGVEEGLSMVFLPESEIRRLFKAFEISDIGRMTVTHHGFSDDDWVIDAVKPLK